MTSTRSCNANDGANMNFIVESMRYHQGASVEDIKPAIAATVQHGRMATLSWPQDLLDEFEKLKALMIGQTSSKPSQQSGVGVLLQPVVDSCVLDTYSFGGSSILQQLLFQQPLVCQNQGGGEKSTTMELISNPTLNCRDIELGRFRSVEDWKPFQDFADTEDVTGVPLCSIPEVFSDSKALVFGPTVRTNSKVCGERNQFARHCNPDDLRKLCQVFEVRRESEEESVRSRAGAAPVAVYQCMDVPICIPIYCT